ncbi:MAG: dodecin [Halobacteria archaeon]|nr:dodecin [Halobacteria archaeon]
MVFKKIRIIGTSTESWEDAALNAVDRAEATIENIKWTSVESQGIELATTDEPQYQTEVEIAFELAE